MALCCDWAACHQAAPARVRARQREWRHRRTREIFGGGAQVRSRSVCCRASRSAFASIGTRERGIDPAGPCPTARRPHSIHSARNGEYSRPRRGPPAAPPAAAGHPWPSLGVVALDQNYWFSSTHPFWAFLTERPPSVFSGLTFFGPLGKMGRVILVSWLFLWFIAGHVWWNNIAGAGVFSRKLGQLVCRCCGSLHHFCTFPRLISQGWYF